MSFRESGEETVMRPIPRRRFLAATGRSTFWMGAGSALLAARRPAPRPWASESFVLATVGAGGRGGRLTRDFVGRGDCRFAWICDPDRRRSGALGRDISGRQGAAPRETVDYREVLDDRAVDAIVVATPDHWHALPTIHGCESGKDVYVEKPASHNVHEGRRMVEAARKHGRVVQVGTQTRSGPYAKRAAELVRSGAIGDIHLCKVFNLKPGRPFTDRGPAPVPDGVDYDRWLGPAPSRPFRAGRFHGGWLFYWDYCGGDMGNDGIHQLDFARWLVGRDYPKSAYATGGNLAFDDDREVPDTQVATFEFEGMVFTFEMTNWPPYMKKTNNQIRESDQFPRWSQNATRIELYGTRHQMVLGRHGGGWQILGPDESVIDQSFGRFPDPPHKENFLECIRSRARPNADIEEGHRSAILAHLGNISYRLGGRKLRFDAAKESIVDAEGRPDEEACRLLGRDHRAPYVP